MSLDNLPANGHLLRGMVLAFAEQVDAGLARWIAAECTFPCSMVDRIVPRTTDADREAVARALGLADAWPVMAEPYLEWVLEDSFAAGRPDWRAAARVSWPEPRRSRRSSCATSTARIPPWLICR